jgi:hypothetical protein
MVFCLNSGPALLVPAGSGQVVNLPVERAWDVRYDSPATSEERL